MITVIPAIDIIDGECVRLTKGDYNTSKSYEKDILAVAKRYEQAGLTHLHLVDLDGAKKGSPKHFDILRNITEETKLHVDFSGGIRNEDDAEKSFDFGANQIAIGSLAVKKPDIFSRWLERYGGEKIILSCDVYGENVATHGWQEESSTSLFELIERFIPSGLKYITCTDISKDGMLEGVNVELYKKLHAKYPTLKITASGGVCSMKDIHELDKLGIYGVITGKALYENKISLEELKEFCTC